MADAFDKLSNEEKRRRVIRRLLGPVKPLTVQDIADGKTHEQYQIFDADDQDIPIPLRNRRNTAYIVECYCPLCDAKRRSYYRG
jgi:hypothetical protein